MMRLENTLTRSLLRGEDFIKKYQDKGSKTRSSVTSAWDSTRPSWYPVGWRSRPSPIRTRRFPCIGPVTVAPEFEMQEGTRKARGTDIILHIGEDGKEFLEEYTLRSTLEKYCSFMPYPIYLVVKDKEPKKDEKGNIIIEEPKPINEVQPLYLKHPNDCTKEDYRNFYRDTFRDFKEPLFWIHLNMDYPFNLKGILYFPKLNTEFESLEGQIKLYNSQVFVADNIKR